MRDGLLLSQSAPDPVESLVGMAPGFEAEARAGFSAHALVCSYQLCLWWGRGAKRRRSGSTCRAQVRLASSLVYYILMAWLVLLRASEGGRADCR